MAKNTKMYKYQIIEHIISNVDFSTKDEVVLFAKKMLELVRNNKEYTLEIKQAFEDAYAEILELTLDNLKEIKKIIS